MTANENTVLSKKKAQTAYTSYLTEMKKDNDQIEWELGILDQLDHFFNMNFYE